MAQVERSTSSGGKRYLTSKAVVFDDVAAKNIIVGGKDNTSGLIQVLDETGTLSVNIDKDGVTLSNGAELIGGSGVLSSLQFDSKNINWGAVTLPGYWFLGYNYAESTGVYKNWLEIDAQIPTNFTVSSAYVTLYHIPVAWAAYTGYVRNVKLYNVSDPTNITIAGAYMSEFAATYTYTTTEISGAFGVNGYSGSDTIGKVTPSSNIASTFSSAGVYKLLIQTDNAVPSFNPGTQDMNDILGTKTGYVYAVLNITGFTQ